MPTFVGSPPDAAEIPPDNPPGPPDPPDPPPLGGGTTYYVSTTGDDGDPGGVLDPFATLEHAQSVAIPGDNIYLRGGSLSGTGNKQFTWTAGGTSGAPITVLKYPGETPIFVGGANGSTDDDVYWFNANGAFNFLVFDGIKLEAFAMIQNGIITLSNQFGGYIGNWTFRNMDIEQLAPADPSAQGIYLGEGFHDLLSQNNIYRGQYPDAGVTGGAAISAAADSGIDPTGIISRGDQFIGFFTGYQLYSVGTTGECSDGIFTGCRVNIDLTRHAEVLIANNSGDHGTDSDIYDPTYSALTTLINNVFT